MRNIFKRKTSIKSYDEILERLEEVQDQLAEISQQQYSTQYYLEDVASFFIEEEEEIEDEVERLCFTDSWVFGLVCVALGMAIGGVIFAIISLFLM